MNNVDILRVCGWFCICFTYHFSIRRICVLFWMQQVCMNTLIKIFNSISTFKHQIVFCPWFNCSFEVNSESDKIIDPALILPLFVHDLYGFVKNIIEQNIFFIATLNSLCSPLPKSYQPFKKWNNLHKKPSYSQRNNKLLVVKSFSLSLSKLSLEEHYWKLTISDPQQCSITLSYLK